MEGSNNFSIVLDINKNENSIEKLFLDTKGACFLCLKEILNIGENENKTSTQNGMTEVNLRNICRYLNINPSSILLKSLKEDEPADGKEEEAISQRNKCDFSVTLCSSCSNLATNLSELICQLEMAKILLKQDVTQFYERLIESEKMDDGSLWKQLQDKLNSNHVDGRLIENLRQETKSKCSTKLENLRITSLPKVRLKQLQIRSSNVQTSSNSKEISNLTQNFSQTASFCESWNLPKLSTPSNKNSVRPTSTSQSSKASSSLTKNSTVNHKKWQCKSINGVSFGCGKLFAQKHRLIVHQKYLCSGEKRNKDNPSIGQRHNIFENKVLTSVLNKYCEKSKDSSSTNYRCLVCQNSPKLCRVSSVIRHLATVHAEEIFAHKRPSPSCSISESDFVRICKETLADKEYFTSMSCNFNQIGDICKICGIQISDRWSNLKYHLVRRHFDILERRLAERLKMENSQQPTVHSCDPVSSNPNHLVNPQINIQDNSMSSMEIGTDDGEEINNDPVGIHATDPLEITSGSYHPDNTASEDAMERPMADEANMRAVYFYSNFHKNNYKRLNKGIQCLHCTYSSAQDRYKISLHLISAHPEKLFMSAKLAQLPEMVFKNCCKMVLASETTKGQQEADRRGIKKQTLRTKYPQPLVCKVCEKTVKTGADYRHHLVFRHFKYFEGFLVEVQTKMFQDVRLMMMTEGDDGHPQEVSHVEEMQHRDGHVEIVLENMEEDVKVSEEVIADNQNVTSFSNDQCLISLSSAGGYKMEAILPDY